MISQYRLFDRSNGFKPDLYTFPLNGKVISKTQIKFMDFVIPFITRSTCDTINDYLESLGYTYQLNAQYDSIQVDMKDSDLEW